MPILKALFLVCFLVTSQSAATFTVTNTNDSGSGSLRQAVLDASTAAGDDIINFDASFGVLRTITLGGTQILINGNGGLTINGPGMNLLTVSGNDASRVFEVSGVNSPSIGTVTFNNMTISLGQVATSGDGTGGGIGINNGPASPIATPVSVIVNNVLFTNNRAGVNTGGAIGTNRSCTLTVNNSIFTQNQANGGGAINNGSGIGSCSSVIVANSTFSENYGVAVSLSGNQGSNPLHVTLNGSSFTNNGINPTNNAVDARTLFIQTTATDNAITNSTFYGNRTTSGAIALNLGSTTMTNATVAGNSSTSNNTPGGIQLSGGAVLNIGNSILAKNTSPSGENNIEAGSGFVSQGYNIIGTNIVPLTIGGTTTGNQLAVDPLVAPVRTAAGLTRTAALRTGSPAIDSGNPTTFPATDQRGISRPQDGDGNGSSRCDIGAYERRPTDLVPPERSDFDGDGRSDISVFRPSNGLWFASRSGGGGDLVVQFGASTDKITPADFDGDGKIDIAVYRPNSQGVWYVFNSSNSSVTVVNFGLGQDLPAAGDYDGDGRADFANFRPSDGTWYIQRSTLGLQITQFGANGDIPAPGDYDGDGKSDLVVWRPSNGVWFERRSSGSDFAIQFGASTDKIVPADYDGDGKTDVGVYRASPQGTWYTVNSSNGAYPVTVFGLANDIPVPADHDGDGRADIGLFRPSDRTWYVNRTTSGLLITQFGLSGDKPTENAFGN